MYVVIFTSLLALFLTYLESNKGLKDGMKYGFVLVTFIAMIHYDYGNDYMAYYNTYNQVISTPFDIAKILQGEVYREPGWALLCYLFEYLGGFFMMVAILNLIQNVIYYKAIEKYVPKKFWVYSVFVYLFTINFYVMNFSMMRQGFTVAVFFAMWPLLRDKKYWITIPVIFALSFVHSSAKILYPFTFIGFLPSGHKTTMRIAFLMMAFWLLLFTNGRLVQTLFEQIVGLDEAFISMSERYESSNGAGSFGLGAFIYLTPFFTLLYFLFKDKKNSEEIHIMAIISLLHVVTAPFNNIIHLVGRMAIYFNTFSIICYPIAYSIITNKSLRYSLAAILAFIIGYDYYLFFFGDGWEPFKVYHTIFEVL